MILRPRQPDAPLFASPALNASLAEAQAFRDGLPPHNGTATSRAAAASMDAGTLAQQERYIVARVRVSRGGLTRQEIADCEEMRLSSVCARVNELIRRGVLMERGERRGESGRMQAVVWVNPVGGGA